MEAPFSINSQQLLFPSNISQSIHRYPPFIASYAKFCVVIVKPNVENRLDGSFYQIKLYFFPFNMADARHILVFVRYRVELNYGNVSIIASLVVTLLHRDKKIRLAVFLLKLNEFTCAKVI